MPSAGPEEAEVRVRGRGFPRVRDAGGSPAGWPGLCSGEGLLLRLGHSGSCGNHSNDHRARGPSSLRSASLSRPGPPCGGHMGKNWLWESQACRGHSQELSPPVPCPDRAPTLARKRGSTSQRLVLPLEGVGVLDQFDNHWTGPLCCIKHYSS